MSNCLELYSTVGKVILNWNQSGSLTALVFLGGRSGSGLRGVDAIPSRLVDVVEGLRLFFDGGQPLPCLNWDLIDTTGMSDFQEAVFRAITRIPHGETRTYAWVAERIGKPSAVRAVGQALRRNPLPVLIPCHRVVASKTIGGFMGVSDPEQPQLELKRRLIELEHNYVNPAFSFITQTISALPLLQPIGAIG